MGPVMSIVRERTSRGRLLVAMAAIAMGTTGCPPTPATGLNSTRFEIHSFGPRGPIVFTDSPPYDVPVHSTHTYTAAQLGFVPKLGVDVDGITAVYWNSSPS